MRFWLFCAVAVFLAAFLISACGSKLLGDASRVEGKWITPGPGRWREPSGTKREGLSVRKQKREMHCVNSTDGCCEECPKGSFLNSCTCERCSNGMYMDYPNSLTECLRCTGDCSDALQVEVKKCTATSNRECGCKHGYYKVDDHHSEAQHFFCKRCTDCGTLNRQTQKNCSEAEDAACGACLPNFHPQGESCLEIRSYGNDTENGPPPAPPKSGFKPEYLLLCLPCLLLLGGLVVYCKRRQVTRNSSPVGIHTLVNSTCVDMLLSACGGASYPKSKSEEPTESPSSASPSHVQPGCSGAGPVPHRSLLQGRKLYAIIDAVPARRWKEFVRGLGLRDGKIEAVEVEYPQLREQQYEMLKRWRQRRGATLDAVFAVLEDMQLGGCAQELRDLLQLGDPVPEVGC